MRVRCSFCKLLVCAIAIGCLGNAGNTLAHEEVSLEGSALHETIAWVVGPFHFDVAGNTIAAADTSFPLEVQETVTIRAFYTPSFASVDFGLIAPDGFFYYVGTTGGSIDKTIRVKERGSYTFAVRNNSSDIVRVSGTING